MSTPIRSARQSWYTLWHDGVFRGKGFASLTKDGWVQLHVSDDEAKPGSDSGDLPPAIGRPALQALRGAGLVTLEQLASKSEKDLLALHGVGPKAVRILTEALRERGMTLR